MSLIKKFSMHNPIHNNNNSFRQYAWIGYRVSNDGSAQILIVDVDIPQIYHNYMNTETPIATKCVGQDNTNGGASVDVWRNQLCTGILTFICSTPFQGDCKS